MRGVSVCNRQLHLTHRMISSAICAREFTKLGAVNIKCLASVTRTRRQRNCMSFTLKRINAVQ